MEEVKGCERKISQVVSNADDEQLVEPFKSEMEEFVMVTKYALQEMQEAFSEQKAKFDDIITWYVQSFLSYQT